MVKTPPPAFMYVHVNKRCNLKCGHCDFWKRNDADKANYLPWPRKAEIIREFAEMSPDGAVVICGGESMLDPEDYFAISRECLQLDLRSMSVINGTRVRTPEMADRMMAEGPLEISVSMNSHIEEIHDRTRGVAGSFQKASDAVRLLVEARRRHPGRGSKIYVMGLVFDQNYKDLDGFYDYVLNNLGADKLKLNFLQPTFGIDGSVDPFYRDHSGIDPDVLVDSINHCDRKYRLGLNPAAVSQAGMYFRSLRAKGDAHLGWGTPRGTSEHICNSYDRNIMIDYYGTARLCFSTSFPGTRLNAFGDLRRFWESAGPIRSEMRKCNAPCGISHSVRRETSTLSSTRPIRFYRIQPAPPPFVTAAKNLLARLRG